jgi:hypothetical protein
VQPSSLVFLVIIGVWAAYFIQYWVRRREHLATVHAADQFSESMRVLERQSAARETAEGARASRPQTLLKRTNATAAAESSVASSARESAGPRPARGSARRGAARRRRGLAVLVAFAALLGTVALAVLSVVPLAAVAVPGVALLAAVGWLRRGVAADRAARLAARPRSRSRRAESAPANSALADLVPAEPLRTAPEADASGSAGTKSQGEEARGELYDLQVVEQGALAAQALAEPEPEPFPTRRLVDEDDIPLTWDPVPVPRPTYTMKSRVTRPASTAADLVGDADTEYAAYEAQEPTRRVAGA